MLAVLVFKNSNEVPELDFLANSLTHDTIGKIGQLCSNRVDVIGHESIATYRNTRKSLHQIGGELAVDYVLSGTVLKDGAMVRITAQLTRVSDQVKLWDYNAESLIGEVSDVQNEIIGKIAASLGVSIHPADVEAMNRASTDNSIAREAYLHGVEKCEDGSTDGLKQCIALLEKALKADSKYARAKVALADALLRSKASPEIAENHVRQALSTTEAIPEGHYVLADILYKFHADDRGADEEFQKAIALNWSDSEARLRYAGFLLQKKRIEDAQEQITRARSLDPFRIDVNIMDGRILIAAQSYDRAIERLGNTVGLDRSSPEIRYYLGQAYLSREMYDDAIREFEKAVSFGPGVPEYEVALANAREAARNRKR
jgi:TolB-like protein/Tfp pilus assembly protein PilF